jgi:hypothetical protein
MQAKPPCMPCALHHPRTTDHARHQHTHCRTQNLIMLRTDSLGKYFMLQKLIHYFISIFSVILFYFILFCNKMFCYWYTFQVKRFAQGLLPLLRPHQPPQKTFVSKAVV